MWLIWLDFHFQFVILVVDSTDRERLSITKEELYKMLSHEVSRQGNRRIARRDNLSAIRVFTRSTVHNGWLSLQL